MAIRLRYPAAIPIRRFAFPASLAPRAPLPFTLRTMSSSAPGRKYEWLVVVPDRPGVLEKRLEIRPQHFANMKPFVDSGTWKMGGAILSEVPPDDDPSSLAFAGSTLVMVAETREEILEVLRNDVYGKGGVWDVEKTQMWPFKCAFRDPEIHK